MAKDIRQLPADIRRAIDKVAYHEATEILETVLKEMDEIVPWDTGRLIDSGFGYINGDLVAETDDGRSNNRLGIVPPVNIPVTNPGEHSFDITISYHTPKPVGEHATVFKREGGTAVFDYAPYVLEGGKEDTMIRTERFRSRRAASLKGIAKKIGTTLTKAQVRASINRGIEKSLTRVGLNIVRALT